MKYTNKYNLAPEVYDAIVSRMGEYDAGKVDYSVTQLIDSPRIVQLKKRHHEDTVADVHDLLDAWQGHLLHDALETEATSSRLEVEVLGRKLSGAWDYYKEGHLKDYKRTSVWTAVYGSMEKKYEAQLNVYAQILRMHGETPESCGIEFFFKDWSEQKAQYDRSYPQARQMYKQYPLWSGEDAMVYMEQRMVLHKQAEETLPLCTAEDMWEKPTVYALMKEGRKSAVKLFDTRTEAEVHIIEKDLDAKIHYVDVRCGERTRCAKYCDVAPFCTQYKECQDGP